MHLTTSRPLMILLVAGLMGGAREREGTTQREGGGGEGGGMFMNGRNEVFLPAVIWWIEISYPGDTLHCSWNEQPIQTHTKTNPCQPPCINN